MSGCSWLFAGSGRLVVLFVSGVYVFFAGACGLVLSAYFGLGIIFWMVTVTGNSLICPMDAVVLSFIVPVFCVLARKMSVYLLFAYVCLSGTFMRKYTFFAGT